MGRFLEPFFDVSDCFVWDGFVWDCFVYAPKNEVCQNEAFQT